MLKKNHVKWVDEELRIIFNMNLKGFNVNEIASQLPKRTVKALKSKMFKMGLSVAEKRGAE